MTPRPLPFDWQNERLARAAWSRLAEPEDHAARALLTLLGPVAGLEWLLTVIDDAGAAGRLAPIPPGAAASSAPGWATAIARWSPRLERLDIRRELDVLAKLGGTLLVPGDTCWHPGLDELELPPYCLWALGNPALLCPEGRAREELAGRTTGDLARKGIGTAAAIVGCRASSDYGNRVTRMIASEYASAGGIVISGGAFGIDAAAHLAALDAMARHGAGSTITVLAGGVDRPYPRAHADMLRLIAEQGALISEAPPGSQPGRHRFLSRNRLIAALSDATLVIEAAWRSGALSTARRARDIGRPLGALPGPVTSMNSAGCHRLLRDGATCITSTGDLLELLGPIGAALELSQQAEAERDQEHPGFLDGLDPLSAQVLDAMPARRATSIEHLAATAGLSTADVSAALGLLEIMGRVERQASGWKRASPNAGVSPGAR